jgi:hypothetical protein
MGLGLVIGPKSDLVRGWHLHVHDTGRLLVSRSWLRGEKSAPSPVAPPHGSAWLTAVSIGIDEKGFYRRQTWTADMTPGCSCE